MIILALMLILTSWLLPLVQNLASRAILGACNLSQPDAQHGAPSKPAGCHARYPQRLGPIAVLHTPTFSGFELPRAYKSLRAANPHRPDQYGTARNPWTGTWLVGRTHKQQPEIALEASITVSAGLLLSTERAALFAVTSESYR